MGNYQSKQQSIKTEAQQQIPELQGAQVYTLQSQKHFFLFKLTVVLMETIYKVQRPCSFSSTANHSPGQPWRRAEGAGWLPSEECASKDQGSTHSSLKPPCPSLASWLVFRPSHLAPNIKSV